MADYATLIAAFDTNSAYDLNGSVAQAKIFIQTCRQLLLMAERTERDGEKAQYSHESVRRMLDAAINWYNANGVDGGGAHFIDFSGGIDP